MSKLSFSNRSWVVFDPANKTHRQWYSEFLATNCWGSCPVRFAIDDNHCDLITMIQSRLVEYYLSNEFSADKATV